MSAQLCRGLLICPVYLLAGCSGPNHLGNPLTLPIAAITNAVENDAYDRERAEVKVWITQNEAAMRAEGFAGPVTGLYAGNFAPGGARSGAAGFG